MKKKLKKENLFYHPTSFKIFIIIHILALVLYLWSTYSTSTCIEGACQFSVFYSDFGWATLMYLLPLIVLIIQQKGHIQAGYVVVVILPIEMSISFLNSPFLYNFLAYLSYFSLDIHIIQPILAAVLVILAFGTHLFMIAKNIDYNLQGSIQPLKPIRVITIMTLYLIYFGLLFVLGFGVAGACGLGGCSRTIWVFWLLIFIVLFSAPLIITHIMARLRKKTK